MTAVERGLVYGGVVLPGTEWIARPVDAMWRAGERGTRERESAPSILVGHWTAGPCREGPRAGELVARSMRARTRSDGSPMSVGIHLVIGWDGLVHQLCDLALATVHVGSRGVNARSVGVEVCWPGTAAHAARVGAHGVITRREVGGRRVDVLTPSSEALASWHRLAETLATHLPIPRLAPLDRDGRPLLDRLSERQARSWRGVLEHLHCPPASSTKIDAAGVLVEALGWPGAQA